MQLEYKPLTARWVEEYVSNSVVPCWLGRMRSMKQMGEMMEMMSGMMGKGMMMDADQKKQMGQMHMQMDRMRKDMLMAPAKKK